MTVEWLGMTVVWLGMTVVWLGMTVTFLYPSYLSAYGFPPARE